MSPVRDLLTPSSSLLLLYVMSAGELDFSSPALQCTSEVCPHHQPSTSETKNNGGLSYSLGTTAPQLNVEEGSSAQSFGYCGLPYAAGLLRHRGAGKKREEYNKGFPHSLWGVGLPFPAPWVMSRRPLLILTLSTTLCPLQCWLGNIGGKLVKSPAIIQSLNSGPLSQCACYFS